MNAQTFPPRSLDSFRVREGHELSDEQARYAAELRRVHAEHADRIEEIKARYWRDSQAWLASRRVRAA